MTPMARKMLAALAAEPNGTLTFEAMRKAAGATMRGGRIVRMRLEDQGMVERPPYDGRPSMTITEVGREALAATR